MASIKMPIDRRIVGADGKLSQDWERVLQQAFDAISGPLPLRPFTLAEMPDASKYIEHAIMVSDATGGAAPAYSNGTNWLRFSNDAIIS